MATLFPKLPLSPYEDLLHCKIFREGISLLFPILYLTGALNFTILTNFLSHELAHQIINQPGIITPSSTIIIKHTLIQANNPLIWIVTFLQKVIEDSEKQTARTGAISGLSRGKFRIPLTTATPTPEKGLPLRLPQCPLL